MSFINQDFLLQSDPAHRLYHDYAIDCPIHDYHSHLSPARIRDNIPFENLSTIWLEGDHYKWRAMRTAGVDESFITGNAPDEEKFLAWATVVPKTIGNPLYHWTHMELLNPFGIDELLGADNALDIFNHCTHMLQRPELHPRGLLRHWNVKTACTTDDPVDDVSVHQEASNEFISVRPTFRPDNVFGFTGSANFNRWLGKLGKKNGHLPDSLDDLLLALESRASVFHKAGCTASDHGLEQMFQGNPDKAIAEKTFTKLKHLENPSTDELRHYRSFLMTELGHMYHRQGWVQQLHLGAKRNANTRALRTLGPDTGFDTMGDYRQVDALANYLDNLESGDSLTRTIIYNLNPADNDALAALIGVFQGGATPGRIQFGAAWWFNDQKTGVERQLESLANVGLLSQFVGMVTDSRSFLSFSRHEYFRRVLCNFLGERIKTGDIPNDFELVGELVRDISYRNTARYFGFKSI